MFSVLLLSGWLADWAHMPCVGLQTHMFRGLMNDSPHSFPRINHHTGSQAGRQAGKQRFHLGSTCCWFLILRLNLSADDPILLRLVEKRKMKRTEKEGGVLHAQLVVVHRRVRRYMQ